MSAFSSKIIVLFFFPKKYLYSKKEFESSVRDFLVLFSVFGKLKVTITENVTWRLCFWNSVSGLLQIGQKSIK